MKVVELVLMAALVAAFSFAAHGADRPLPEYLKRATVYQMVLRNFTRDGTFKAAEAMLPHVRSAGVDVVYLTPFVEMDTDMDEAGWSPSQKRSGFNSPKNPYRVMDFNKVDPEYGTFDDWTAFQKKAHALGMKVFLDLVYVHCGPHEPRDADRASRLACLVIQSIFKRNNKHGHSKKQVNRQQTRRICYVGRICILGQRGVIRCFCISAS